MIFKFSRLNYNDNKEFTVFTDAQPETNSLKHFYKVTREL